MMTKTEGQNLATPGTCPAAVALTERSRALGRVQEAEGWRMTPDVLELLPVTFTLPSPAPEPRRGQKLQAARAWRRVEANLARQGYQATGVVASGGECSEYRVLLLLREKQDRIRVRSALEQSFPGGPVPRLHFAKSQEQGQKMVEAWWRASIGLPVRSFYGLPADGQADDAPVLAAAAVVALWGFKGEPPTWLNLW